MREGRDIVLNLQSKYVKLVARNDFHATQTTKPGEDDVSSNFEDGVTDGPRASQEQDCAFR